MDALIRELQNLGLGLSVFFNDQAGNAFDTWTAALAYADDLCLIFGLPETQQITQVIEDWCQRFNLEIADKSKYMIFNSDMHDDEYALTIGEQDIERVSEFKYLGFDIQEQISCENHL